MDEIPTETTRPASPMTGGPVSRRQQETDAMFRRGLARARTREQRDGIATADETRAAAEAASARLREWQAGQGDTG